MYLSYIDYQNMGGTLEETAFDNLAFEAQSIIDWYTFNRLRNEEYENLQEEVKRCMFNLITLIQKKMIAESNGGSSNSTSETSSSIASQSNDGVSISYNIMSAKEASENAKSEIELTVKRYLSYVTNSLGRKVLYRGIYPGE